MMILVFTFILPKNSNVYTLSNADKLVVHGYDSKADLILPISRDLPLNDGLWFEIQNSTDVHSKEFKISQNVYRAVLEVYVSPHENDEFWYTNYVNECIVANNLTDVPGNGPFREVIVSLDGNVVGAVWPFIVKQTIDCKDNVIAKTASSYVHSVKTLKSFPFYLYTENIDQGNETSTMITNLTVGFAEKRVKTSEYGSSVISSLNNKEKGQATML